jgi:hypothetical protein
VDIGSLQQLISSSCEADATEEVEKDWAAMKGIGTFVLRTF